MKPGVNEMRVDKLLSQVAQRYRNENYVAEEILPFVKVKEKTGKFAKFGKENYRAYKGQIHRAPGTRAHTIDYSVSQGSYSCDERSLEKPVPWEFYDNFDAPYNPEEDAVGVIMDNIWVNQELALSEFMGDTSLITLNTTLVGTSQWTDPAGSDPLANIKTAIDTVKNTSGKRPNVLLFCEDAFDTLKVHPLVREQLKYTGVMGNPSDDALVTWLKSFFKIEEVIVGTALHMSSDEGQTDNLDAVWTGNVWAFYRPRKPSALTASFGYTFSDVPRQVDKYEEVSHKRTVVRVSYSYDQNIMDTNLAYLIKAAV